MRNKYEKIILLLAVLGMMLAGYALPLHYSDDGHSICNISESFNCDKVNKSPWSDFFGIPVATLGLLANLFLFLTVLKRKTIQKKLEFTEKDVWQYVGILILVMTGFQVYLTLTEILFIHAYCIICLTNQVMVVILLWAIFNLWRKA